MTRLTLLNRILLLLLLPAVLLQSIGAALLWVDYAVNTEAYASNCINKARPQLQCNGKCQLMLKIQQKEQQQQQQTAMENVPRFQPIVLQHYFFVYAFLSTPTQTLMPVLAAASLHRGFHQAPWHPPGC